MALQDMVSMQYLQKGSISRSYPQSERHTLIPPAPPYKTYPDARRFPLPVSMSNFELSVPNFNQLLKKRRSCRDFSRERISFDSLAHLLWAGQGTTTSANGRSLRTAPSAGALYPIETYLSVQQATDLPTGLYHFNTSETCLELISEGKLGPQIAEACLNQTFLTQAEVIFIWSAMPARTLSRYGDRGLRYIFMDAAHICQNVLLAAEAQGKCGCPVGAFFDDELNAILQVDGSNEAAIYLAAIGAR